jgi:hypothetical protein
MGRGNDIHLQDLDSRQGEPPAGPSRATTASNPSADVELELERLRAERDAMAAELQIERAERLHVEERLRLLEREKLEQLRQGAASREKLASELEEARLRAMRAEARQAALEADTRLHEIESRRRGPWSSSDAIIDSLANEIAEPGDDASDSEPEAGDEPEAELASPGRGRAIPLAGPAPNPFARSRPAGAEVGERAASGRAPVRTDRDHTGAGGWAKPAAAKPTPERRPQPANDPQPLSTSRLRGPATPPAHPVVDARGPGARTPPAAGPGGPDAGGPDARRGHGPEATGGAPAAARGGAAAGRPSIDRAQLEARLAAGAVIKTTERFRQFQPVARGHIKVCDWLKDCRTLAEIEARSAGQVAPSEILSVLVLFFERSFLVLEQS